MNKCARSSGFLLKEYFGDISCVMCGWVSPPPLMPLKLSVPTGEKHLSASHLDPSIPSQYKKIKSFYKRCPGSGRTGIAVNETTVRCTACKKNVEAGRHYRTPRHLPAKQFAETITDVLSRQDRLEKGEVSLTENERQRRSSQL